MDDNEVWGNDKPNKTDESRIENYEDIFDDIEEEEDEEPMQRKFPAWVIVAVTMLVLVSFIAISLPDLSLLIGERFDFLSQNASLENDPLVLAARDTVVSLTAMGVKNLPENSRAGTGFLISAGGYILTNLHVVEGAQKVKVELKNGDVYYAKNYLPLLDLDVAIIHIDAADLTYLTLAAESLPELNEPVTVVGNPLGFMRIAARGTINRYLNLSGAGQVMEINLSTKPGSSGSPVMNNKGQAVGIVFAILTQEENKETKNTTLAIPLYLIDDELNKMLSDKNWF